MNDTAVSATNLARRFGRHWAVQDLTFDVPKGAVFGLLGPNGSGKTTTINMLMGLLPPTAGQLSVLGLDPQKQEIAVRRKVGYVPEHFGFYEWMKVQELVNLISPYYDKWNHALCASMQAEFGLDGYQRISHLSKGMRAKLALLLALSHEPEMLVLDEPTGGLDPAARRKFIETILSNYQEEGKTILVSSHLLNEFAGLLDHVAFIKNGQVELISKLDELHKSMKRARLIFNDGVPSGLQIPATLSLKTNGREALAVCRDFDEENTPKRLQETGASNVVIEEMSLEDIFVELVGS